MEAKAIFAPYVQCIRIVTQETTKVTKESTEPRKNCATCTKARKKTKKCMVSYKQKNMQIGKIYSECAHMNEKPRICCGRQGKSL